MDIVNTKEKILLTALQLFAKDGYEAVSVSTLANEIGITKGALYKHYKNKRDIFDSIVKRMYEIDEERAKQYNVPEKEYEKDSASYSNTELESIKEFTLAQFAFWTEDSFATDFRKMLSLEKYRNSEMAELYDKCILGGPILYMRDLFKELSEKGVLKKTEPLQLALEYYAPMYMLINMADSDNNEELKEMLKKHIKRFFKNNKRTKNI